MKGLVLFVDKFRFFSDIHFDCVTVASVETEEVIFQC